jgi:cellulose synthase/poly-beta-1,6-N-acetylglucosamine synthase-like glycosyltransferase
VAARLIFFLASGIVFYAYVGYPVLLWVSSRLFGQPHKGGDITPRVSVIIAARNEQRDIGRKIETTLASDYPRGKLEIIVVSDASTDATDEIVARYELCGVRLLRQPRRVGKTGAQNLAVQIASGHVLVFTDATSCCEPHAIRNIVRPFADPQVGCVGGQLVYRDDRVTAIGSGCIRYWSYEKLLKQWESRLGSLIGVSGALYAVRRSCFRRLPDDLIDDLSVVAETHLQRLRAVYEPRAMCVEDTLNEAPDEFRMRVRVIEQTLRTVAHYRAAINPFRHGSYGVKVISHKLLRYGAAPLLPIVFAANVALAGMPGWPRAALACQVVLYLAGLAGFIGERLGVRMRFIVIPYYFALGNIAAIAAFGQFLYGRRYLTWEPIRGDQTDEMRPALGRLEFRRSRE